MTNPISRAEPLLPCPFCGGEAIMQVGMSSFGDYEISCTKCFMCGPTFGAMEETLTPKEDAIAAWNTRDLHAVTASQPDPRDVVIARLVDGISFYADWDSWVLDERGVSLIEQDEGKLARAAIAAAKGGA